MTADQLFLPMLSHTKTVVKDFRIPAELQCLFNRDLLSLSSQRRELYSSITRLAYSRGEVSQVLAGELQDRLDRWGTLSDVECIVALLALQHVASTWGAKNILP